MFGGREGEGPCRVGNGAWGAGCWWGVVGVVGVKIRVHVNICVGAGGGRGRGDLVSHHARAVLDVGFEREGEPVCVGTEYLLSVFVFGV